MNTQQHEVLSYRHDSYLNLSLVDVSASPANMYITITITTNTDNDSFNRLLHFKFVGNRITDPANRTTMASSSW